jgi:hypothetical protein
MWSDPYRWPGSIEYHKLRFEEDVAIDGKADASVRLEAAEADQKVVSRI